MANVEIVQRGIQVSGAAIAEVQEEILALVQRNSQWGQISFTDPVKDAAGQWVSRGHIRLEQP